MWAQLTPLWIRFRRPINTYTSLAQLSSLTGLVMFCYSVFLSARFKFFERLFGAMNRVYIAHHIIGGLAFILLMAHPLLISASFLTIKSHKAVEYLLPGADWSINFALLALSLMIAQLTFTFYAKLPYQLWRWTHKLLGVSLTFAVLHILLVESDIKRTPMLRNYYLVLTGLALVIFVYRSLLGRLLVGKYGYVVSQVFYPAANVVSLTMAPVSKPMQYEAGQFVFLELGDKATGGESHPFSIASAPEDPELTIIAKSLGNYTRKMPMISVGSPAKVEGPFGGFNFRRFRYTDQIWVAGGIGITPFLSMARSFKDSDYRIVLFYSVMDSSELLFLNNLQMIAEQYPSFRLVPFISKEKGHITAEYTMQISGFDIRQIEVLVCGPPPMMKSLRKQYHSLGLTYFRIHTEEFTMD